MIVTTPLLEQADTLRRNAASRTPGRLADLVETRVLQLLGTHEPSVSLPDDLTAAEHVVVGLVEQFLVDVHGITDHQFAEMAEHYTSEEQVAILFHLALVDGFSKLDKVHGTTENDS